MHGCSACSAQQALERMCFNIVLRVTVATRLKLVQDRFLKTLTLALSKGSVPQLQGQTSYTKAIPKAQSTFDTCTLPVESCLGCDNTERNWVAKQLHFVVQNLCMRCLLYCAALIHSEVLLGHIYRLLNDYCSSPKSLLLKWYQDFIKTPPEI